MGKEFLPQHSNPGQVPMEIEEGEEPTLEDVLEENRLEIERSKLF